MTTDHDQFLTQLPKMLRMLAEPTTLHTAFEVWCRIDVIGWDACVPVLRSELQSGDDKVKLLILDIINQQAEILGTDTVESFFTQIFSLLADENRLVRAAVIFTMRELFFRNPNATSMLRQIVAHDEPKIAAEAMITLLEMDPNFVTEIAHLFRD